MFALGSSLYSKRWKALSMLGMYPRNALEELRHIVLTTNGLECFFDFAADSYRLLQIDRKSVV